MAIALSRYPLSNGYLALGLLLSLGIFFIVIIAVKAKQSVHNLYIFGVNSFFIDFSFPSCNYSSARLFQFTDFVGNTAL